MLVVSQRGEAPFSDIRSALRYLAESRSAEELLHPDFRETIYIREGIYREQVELRIPNLTLIGDGEDRTVITGSRCAYQSWPDLGRLGTFRSYTMLVQADGCALRNLTVENSAGSGPEIGQGIALYADGDHFRAENCRISGCQDSLFTGPLPPRPMSDMDSFTGPGQYLPRRNTRQLYRHCRIEGDIDFIFGSASAWFEACTICQKRRKPERGEERVRVHSYGTAASTPKGQRFGYVFHRCRFIGDAPEHSCYLGRPWREHARVVVLRSELGAQLHPAGWDNWNKKEAEKTVFFAEYGNYGAGADMSARPPYVRRLTEAEAEEYTLEELWGR